MLENYSTALAIGNFLPAICLAFGLFFLARMLKSKNEVIGELGYTGGLLILTGSLLPPIWKLFDAHNDTNWMKNGSLMLIAPGFVCLAWALWKAFHSGGTKMTAGQVWLLPLFLNAGVLALSAGVKLVKGGSAWLTMLLVVSTVASVAAGLQLAMWSLRHKKTFVAGLFLLNLGMSLSLNWQTNQLGSTQSAEWARLVSSSISQAVFAFAAYKLARATMR